MFFSELFNNINNSIKEIKYTKDHLPDTKPPFKRMTSDLNQGVKYRNNNIHKIKKNLKNSILMEGFGNTNENSNINELNYKEQHTLEAKRNQYQRELSNYSTAYTNFMNNYFKQNENVKECKIQCRKNYKEGSDKLKQYACLAGCDIKGPYIMDCKDTYTGSIKGNKLCSDNNLTGNKCAGGKVLGGIPSINELSKKENKDENDVSPIDGCCKCGGGVGGKPKGTFGNDIITNCLDIKNDDKNIEKELQSICLASNVDMVDSDTLLQQYRKLQGSNKNLNDITTSIFKNYKDMNNQRKHHDVNIQKQEIHNGESIDKYNNLNDEYANLVKKNANELSTINGQVENSKLNYESESIKYVLWMGITALFVAIVNKKMNEN